MIAILRPKHFQEAQNSSGDVDESVGRSFKVKVKGVTRGVGVGVRRHGGIVPQVGWKKPRLNPTCFPHL